MKGWFIAVTAGRWQLCGIKAAKRLGYKVVAIDSDINAPGFEYADEHICCGFENVQSIINYLSNKSIVGCLSICSDAGMLLAGKLIDHFNLSGPGLNVSKRLTDKGLQREAWQNAGIHNPNFYVGNQLQDLINRTRDFNFPLIIKPVDSAGSRGITKIHNQSELTKACLDNAISYSKRRQVIIEEFVTGQEYTVETIICNGKIHLLAITKKYKLAETNYTVAYKLETAEIPIELQTKITQRIAHAYQTLEYYNGIGHAEIIVSDDDKVVIVEVAGRGGGFLVFEEFLPRISSLDIVELTVLQACGQPIEITEKTEHYGILEFLPSSEGIVKNITGFKAVNTLPYCTAESFVAIGDKVKNADCDGARLGYILCCSDDKTLVRSTVQKAKSLVKVEVARNESY